MRQRKGKPKSTGSACRKPPVGSEENAWDEILADATTSRPDQPSKRRLSKSLLSACAASALLLYVNANSNEWALDDFSAVVRNQDVRGSSPLWPDLFRNDFWGTPMDSASSHKSFRPLAVWFSRANAAWCGGTEGSDMARCFHRWNWALYALCVMVAACALGAAAGGIVPGAGDGTTLVPWNDEGKRKSRSPQQPVGKFDWYLVTASLVFVFHPIHTEAVASVVGRADTLSGMIAFAAFICHSYYLKTRMDSDKNAKTGALNALFVAVIALSWAAALCKETGITTLAICGAQEIALIWIPALIGTPELSRRKRTMRSEMGPSLARFSALALSGVAYLVLRSRLSGSTQGLSVQIASFLDNPLLFAPTKICRVLTALHIQALYTLRLLWPFGLLCEYGYDVIPLIHSLDDTRNALTAIWVLGMMGLTLLGVRRAASVSGDARIIVALAWMFAPLLPASHVVDIGTVLAERLLFLPSLGYAMLLGIWVEHWIRGGNARAAGRQKRTRTNIAFIILAIVLIAFGAEVVKRNPDWFNNRALWEATYKSHPSNVKMSHALADARLKDGDAAGAYKISVDNYNRIEALSSEQRAGLASLAVFSILAKSIVALSRTGMEGMSMERAMAVLDEAAAIAEARKNNQKFDFSMYLIRAELLAQNGDFAEARTWSEKALGIAEKVNPQEPDPPCLHGTLLMSTGASAEGIPKLEHCIELWKNKSNDHSEYVDAMENLGKAYFSLGRYADAEEYLTQAMAVREVGATMKLLTIARKRAESQALG